MRIERHCAGSSPCYVARITAVKVGEAACALASLRDARSVIIDKIKPHLQGAGNTHKLWKVIFFQ